MRNAEYRTAQGSVESPACHVGASPPAHVIIGPVCIAQSPLSANNIPHSALRIPHSLVVRSTANHPFAPSVEPRGGGLSWERMRSAECGMRNAEYRAAQGSVESPACRVGPSARAHNYRSCLHRLVASICKQYSAFRTPHSAFPNRSIHGQPSVCSERGAARWRPVLGTNAECGMRNAQCGIPNCTGQRGIAGLSCWSIPPRRT